jgi:c-di-GMP-binding flagellar brake protein YcgR
MKLFGRAKVAEQPGTGVAKNQRVEIKIRGVGRTSGLVKEVDGDAAMIALVVSATPEAIALEAPDAILEYTTLRGLYRQKGFASYPNRDTLRFVGQEEPELVQRREFVRVDVNIPVSVSLKDAPWPTDFDALNLSANGILLAAPNAGVITLKLGMFVWMKIPLYDGKGEIDVRGTVVREAQKGAVGIRFDHINEGDQERLVRFVAREEREQRKREAC